MADLGQKTKSAILSSHICHKTPWRHHLSQIGHGDYKKYATAIRHGRYLTTL